MTRDGLKILIAQAGPDSNRYPFRSHPLGLMSLAAYVEREIPGTSVDALDMKVSDARPGDIGRIAAERGADIVGLSALTVHWEEMAEAARAARAAVPGALIVAGGPHATCFSGRVLDSGLFDAAVLGEGEKPFLNIVRARMRGERPEGIPAVATPQRPVPDVPRDVVDDPDALPFPAWNKINLEAYRRRCSFSVMGRRNHMSLFTSRACPFECAYCHNIFGHKFRPRSAHNVLAEIRAAHSLHGFSDFDILDDVFNLRRSRVINICRGLIDDGPKISMAFPNGLRGDLLDDELLEIMREAGTTFISFAVETASPRLQKKIHKNLNLDKLAAAIRKADSLGIFSNAYCMVGFPTETESELKSTIRFVAKSPVNIAHFLTVTPFEGTRLYEMLDEEARARAARAPGDMRYEDRAFNLSDIPDSKFRRIVHLGLMRFYLNPFRAAKIILRHPQPKNLLAFARMAFNRIFING